MLSCPHTTVRPHNTSLFWAFVSLTFANKESLDRSSLLITFSTCPSSIPPPCWDGAQLPVTLVRLHRSPRQELLLGNIKNYSDYSVSDRMGRIIKSSIRPHTACHTVTLQRPALKQSKCIRNFLGDFQMLSKKKKKKKRRRPPDSGWF